MSAPSFHANANVAVRIAINTNMSGNATIPTRLKATAHGNVNTISIFEATNSKARSA